MIVPLEWTGFGLRFLDQTKLPFEEIYIVTDNEETVAEAIRSLSIRGAPLLGIAAAYGITLALKRCSAEESMHWRPIVEDATRLLGSTRPTAKNLFGALERINRVLKEKNPSTGKEAFEISLAESKAIHREDATMCDDIGNHGAALLPASASVITHCNTGALATGGIGTALGIIYKSWEQGKISRVYIDETRPLLQGARLTTWELMKHEIPCTLLTDSMSAYLMSQNKIDAVLVGADRITSCGDVANKIGTYALAITARYHNVPFYVAAPSTTIDMAISSGKHIEIERRKPEELTQIFGVPISPIAMNAFNPAFDVTPYELITAIITENGIWKPSKREVST
jgi:methylthioribose-1-phosphate isomerase